MFKIKVDAGDN